jgi:hypothetical protein
MWAMEHCDTFPRGRTFTVYSNNKPLEAHSKRHEKTLSRLQEAYTRWSFNIVYKKGSEMPADYLSRNVEEAIRVPDEDLADQQNKDPFCETIKNILQNEPIQHIYKKKFLKPAEKLALTCSIEKEL